MPNSSIKRKPVILVIEDDVDIRESLADLLLLEGYEVRLANNGEEGLAVLASLDTACLTLLDLMMPVLDGEGFLRKKALLPREQDWPVIALSATRSARREGVRAFIRKPLDLHELIGTVLEHLPE